MSSTIPGYSTPWDQGTATNVRVFPLLEKPSHSLWAQNTAHLRMALWPSAHVFAPRCLHSLKHSQALHLALKSKGKKNPQALKNLHPKDVHLQIHLFPPVTNLVSTITWKALQGKSTTMKISVSTKLSMKSLQLPFLQSPLSPHPVHLKGKSTGN